MKNKEVLKKIIKAGEIKAGDLVLEIGSGTGVLTEAILQTKAKVVAIEKDSQMTKFLKEKFPKNRNLLVVEQDIRDFLRLKIGAGLGSGFKIKNLKFKVVGNIPYYLTSYLIRQLLESEVKPSLIVLMVQKEVGQRITANPPKMNLLAASVQFFAEAKIIASISKSSFWPKPKVDSAIIKISPFRSPANTDENFKKSFFHLLKAGFSQPRKLLLNNLGQKLKIPKEKLKIAFQKTKLPLNCRSQNLSLENWLNLLDELLF